MMSSIYVGMTGLMSYAKGLDIISNNVANMNTPGFKKSDLQFQNLVFDKSTSSRDEGQQTYSAGQGVEAKQTTINYKQGEMREVSDSNSVAIDGNGFFVLRDENQLLYTRHGDFEFDGDGYLVSSSRGGRVAALENDKLVDININNYKKYNAVQTSIIKVHNNISSTADEHTLDNIEIVDPNGNVHNITLRFRNNSATTPGSWLVTVVDNTDIEVEVGSGEIRFNLDGTPEEDYNVLNVSFSYSDSSSIPLEINFGEPGSLIGTTSFDEGQSSSISIQEIDGAQRGALIKSEFDSKGQITYHYSNGEEQKGAVLALAWFDDLQALEQIDGSVFRSHNSQKAYFGAAEEGVFGSIQGGQIELSNVELTLEFSDLIIIQRGYQASSQILTITNEIIQQTLDMGSKR